MKTQLLIAAAFSALALGSAVASTASAEPDFYYRTSPPSSNPHDVFRTSTKVYRTPEAAALAARKAACDCSMMKGNAAMQDQCMAMMSGPNAAAKPGAAG